VKLIQIFLGENDNFLRGREASAMPDEKKKIIVHIVPEKFRDDVNRLSAYIGEDQFESGLSIEVSLNELLNVVPRRRRRRDAYDALVKYLKNERDITLIIKTTKND